MLRSDSLAADDARFEERLGSLLDSLGGTGIVEQAGDPRENQALVSTDRSAALIPVRLTAAGEEDPEPLVAAVQVRCCSAGSAFVLAMAGLLLVPDTVMRSLAAGAILVALVAMVAALTLLPALLALLGDRVNSLRIPFLGRRLIERGGQEGRLWGGIVRAVLRRPGWSFAAGAALLLLAAAPA